MTDESTWSTAMLRLLILLALPSLLFSCQSAKAVDETEVMQDSEVLDDSDEFDEFDDFDEFETDEPEETSDPLIGYNRMMFGFNDWFFLNVWNPTAKGYRYIAPQGARLAVDRFFNNLTTPIRFGNSLLQLKFEKSGDELGRLLINSTLGLAGLFDVAESWFDWSAPSPEDFGQTLASYGVGAGPPLVLPFWGPSNLRDGIGLIPDAYLSPAFYFTEGYEGFALTAFDKTNFLSLHIGEYESLKGDALDPYTLFRDAYGQYRENLIEE